MLLPINAACGLDELKGRLRKARTEPGCGRSCGTQLEAAPGVAREGRAVYRGRRASSRPAPREAEEPPTPEGRPGPAAILCAVPAPPRAMAPSPGPPPPPREGGPGRCGEARAPSKGPAELRGRRFPPLPPGAGHGALSQACCRHWAAVARRSGAYCSAGRRKAAKGVTASFVHLCLSARMLWRLRGESLEIRRRAPGKDSVSTVP